MDNHGRVGSKSAALSTNYGLLPGHMRLAGDSSGGNLALSIIAWVGDEKLRAPDAVIVMSPQTDATLSGPSLVQNIETDLMQGASFGPVVKVPARCGFGLWLSNAQDEPQ